MSAQILNFSTPEARTAVIYCRVLRENTAQLHALDAQLARIDAEEPPRFEVMEPDLSALAECLVGILRQEYNAAKTRALFAGFLDRILIENATVAIEYHPDRMITSIQTASRRPVPSKRDWLPNPPLLGIKTLVVDLPRRMVSA